MTEWTTAGVIKSVIWLIIAILFTLVIVGSIYSGFETTSHVIKKYIFFGTETIELETTTTTGELGGVITAIMIWLIIFVTFGDILENFSAFSSGIGWLVAVALSVVAANTGVIQATTIWLVGLFVWAGVAAAFLGLLFAFVAFILVNIGGSWITTYLKNRRIAIKASTGKEIMRGGANTLAAMGRASTRAGAKGAST